MRISRIVSLTTTLVVSLGALAAMPPAHADWEGTIIGKVVYPDGTPANAYGVSATGLTDGNGATDDGSGYGYTDNHGVYRIQIERNNTYSIDVDGVVVDAQNAVGTAGMVTTGPTFTLPAPTNPPIIPVPAAYSAVVSITGGEPAKARVRVQSQVNGDWSDNAKQATDGRFYFTGLTPGAYKVAAYGYGHDGNYVGVIWSGNKANSRDAVIINIGDKTDLGTMNIPSDRVEGTITGHVQMPSTPGFNEWSAEVTAYPLNAFLGTISTDTDAAGNFSIDLGPGAYVLVATGMAANVVNHAAKLNGTTAAFPPWVPQGYTTAPAWFGGTSFATAKQLILSPGGTINSINFQLTNTLKPLVKPALRGSFRAGKRVKVSTGTWNVPNFIVFTYEWRIGHKVVGTGSSLKLSKKIWAKASKLTVTVTAHDKNGGVYDGSVKLKVAKALG